MSIPKGVTVTADLHVLCIWDYFKSLDSISLFLAPDPEARPTSFMLPSDPLVENCDYRCEECGKGAGGMTVFSMLRTLEEVSDGQKAFDLKVKI